MANAFGTSVGSRVLTLRQACVIAAVMNFSGLMLLGKGTADTIAKGVSNLDAWKSSPGEFMLMMLCESVVHACQCQRSRMRRVACGPGGFRCRVWAPSS